MAPIQSSTVFEDTSFLVSLRGVIASGTGKGISLAMLLVAALLAVLFAWYALYVCLTPRDADWFDELDSLKARPGLKTRIWRVLTFPWAHTASTGLDVEASPMLKSKSFEKTSTQTDWLAYHPALPYASSPPLLSIPDFPPIAISRPRSLVKHSPVPLRSPHVPIRRSPDAAPAPESDKPSHAHSRTPYTVCCNPATYTEDDLAMARFKLDVAFADLQARFGPSCGSWRSGALEYEVVPTEPGAEKTVAACGFAIMKGVADPEPAFGGSFGRV
ncbi:uncharacterized protein C8Q71DRAFT_107747 [Rhodofomes roseus]|uniref:Uncharacterized protein n=1 Tax=Rhodofomes roseus TaxID=34475 RepID=A0ABQ8KC56_9APHY|nr:uncharacterized protein C8Q71DRAFT_107747 [Rhodofomes roseus]KAH9835186.1 hypothetical protein C8Q71DRAFT_107747 [Rhodofomes roseus]